MRNPKLTIRRLVGLSLGLCAAALVGAVAAQNPDGTRVRSAAAGPAEPPHHRANEVGWRLAPSEQKYASIDGNRLKSYVGELTAMARRYRDNGHPQFWGRIIGTTADTENAEWMMQKFRQIGLTDVHEQYFDLPPQWMPKSWSVTVSGSGKAIAIDTAQPTYQAVGTPADGLDLEAVYVGMASCCSSYVAAKNGVARSK